MVIVWLRGLMQRKSAIPTFNQSRVPEAGERIVKLYQDWGKPDQAGKWRQQLSGLTSSLYNTK